MGLEATIDQRAQIPRADQACLQAAGGQQVQHGKAVLAGFLLERAERGIVDGQCIRLAAMVERDLALQVHDVSLRFRNRDELRLA
jgi:hypothetical protein